MYTAIKTADVVDKQKRRRIVTVTFTDGTDEFSKEFQFSVETEVLAMKRVVKDYLDELNFVAPDITGDIADYTEPAPDTPTSAELEKRAWGEDKATLLQLQELVDLGVFDGTETQIVNLQAKVRADFKPAFLN